VSTYVARAAEKLRRQASVAAVVHVFVHTNRFKDDEPQYNAGRLVPLPEPSDDTLVLTHYALLGLKAIFRPGYRYKKAGIMLTLLSDKAARQGSLFDDPEARVRSARRMAVLDAINRQFGRDTLRSGASGTAQRWGTRSENRSPRYTTRWDELPEVS
jgi:DNA polymerase V